MRLHAAARDSSDMLRTDTSLANPPAGYRSLSGPSARSVPGVSLGVSLGPFGPRALECPKSVLRVSPQCPGHLFDTPGTLSRQRVWTLQSPGREGSRDTRETLRAHFRSRATPVAGRGVRNTSCRTKAPKLAVFFLCQSFPQNV